MKRKIIALLLAIMTVTLCFSTTVPVMAAADGIGIYRITASSGLNVRKGPSTSYSIVGAIPYNKTVAVSEVSGSWGKATYGSISGWISLTYAQKTQSTSSSFTTYEAIVTASSGLNMRSGPSTSYGIKTAIPHNTRIAITSTSGSWGKTSYKGYTGWVSLSYTKRVDSTTISQESDSDSSFSIDSGVYLKQAESRTCTLCSATMLLRAHYSLDGKSYSAVTEAAVKKVAWISGVGLKWNFTYGNYSIAHGDISQKTTAQKKSYLIDYLEDHPEGIVVYDTGKPHAILLVEYDSSTDTFYCADPSNATSSGKIKLVSSTIPGNTQNKVLATLDAVWYIQ